MRPRRTRGRESIPPGSPRRHFLKRCVVRPSALSRNQTVALARLMAEIPMISEADFKIDVSYGYDNDWNLKFGDTNSFAKSWTVDFPAKAGSLETIHAMSTVTSGQLTRPFSAPRRAALSSRPKVYVARYLVVGPSSHYYDREEVGVSRRCSSQSERTGRQIVLNVECRVEASYVFGMRLIKGLGLQAKM